MKRAFCEFSFEAGPQHAVRFARKLGGCSVNDLACYPIDALHRMLGQPLSLKDCAFERGRGEMADIDISHRGRYVGRSRGAEVEVEVEVGLARPRSQHLTLEFEGATVVAPDFFTPAAALGVLTVTGTGSRQRLELPEFDRWQALLEELEERLSSHEVMVARAAEDERRWRHNTRLLEELNQRRDTFLEEDEQCSGRAW